MKETKTDAGPIFIRSFEYEKSDEFFFFVSIEHLAPEMIKEKEITKLLDGPKDKILAGVEGKVAKEILVKEMDIVMEGYPGRRVILEFPEGGSAEHCVVLVNTRLYTIGAAQAKGRSVPECREFLDSFTLLDVSGK